MSDKCERARRSVWVQRRAILAAGRLWRSLHKGKLSEANIKKIARAFECFVQEVEEEAPVPGAELDAMAKGAADEVET